MNKHLAFFALDEIFEFGDLTEESLEKSALDFYEFVLFLVLELQISYFGRRNDTWDIAPRPASQEHLSQQRKVVETPLDRERTLRIESLDRIFYNTSFFCRVSHRK